jgi:magnesium transporter
MVRLITQQGQLIDWNEEKTHPFPDNLVFLDLLNPSRTEELDAEKWLEYQLPTREEMQEIEESSRLYSEKGALYMTAWIPVGLDTPDPDTTPISFVLAPDCLTTVRYADPLAFRALADQVKRQCKMPISSDAVFLLLCELIIGRIADALQNVEGDLKRINREIFVVNPSKASTTVERDLAEVIKLLGRRSALVANLRESLVSISRILQFFLNNGASWMSGALAAQFRSVMRDVKSLDDYVQYLETHQENELPFLISSLTTHTTEFFRDSEHFDDLAREVLPAVIARREPIRIWSAASSGSWRLRKLAAILLPPKALHLPTVTGGQRRSSKFLEIRAGKAFDRKLE